MSEQEDEEYANRLVHRLKYRRKRLHTSSADGQMHVDPQFDNAKDCSPLKANTICSDLDPDYGNEYWIRNTEGMHYLLLDCDYQVDLITSSSGNNHLIFGRPMSLDDMLHVMKAMAEVGLIQTAYYESAKQVGHATLRAPGINKWQPENNYGLDDNGEIEKPFDYDMALRTSQKRLKEQQLSTEKETVND